MNPKDFLTEIFQSGFLADTPERYKNMNYKIVVDSCCELPESFMKDSRFERVPLELTVGDYNITDDDTFDQADFLKRVAECEECPKSACPSPERYMNAYNCEAEHVYCVTLSSKLSGSYNSAVLATELYEETYGEKQIHVFDSESASVGETQIALLIMKLEEKGLPFEEIVDKVEHFRNNLHTYFVLDNLETLRKNGRLSGLKALVASTLNIKPVMAGDKGTIVQRGQGIGIKKALGKLVDTLMEEVQNTEHKVLMISHCNAPERAELVKKMILARDKFAEVIIVNMMGTSSLYANDGGIIVTA